MSKSTPDRRARSFAELTSCKEMIKENPPTYRSKESMTDGINTQGHELQVKNFLQIAWVQKENTITWGYSGVAPSYQGRIVVIFNNVLDQRIAKSKGKWHRRFSHIYLWQVQKESPKRIYDGLSRVINIRKLPLWNALAIIDPLVGKPQVISLLHRTSGVI